MKFIDILFFNIFSVFFFTFLASFTSGQSEQNLQTKLANFDSCENSESCSFLKKFWRLACIFIVNYLFNFNNCGL